MSSPYDTDTSFDYKQHLARHKKAWERRQKWDRLYNETFEWCFPHRLVKNKTVEGQAQGDIFISNDVSITATSALAGRMHTALFSVDGEPLSLEISALAKQYYKQDDAAYKRFEMAIEQAKTTIFPFFRSTEYANATKEVCQDLVVGTGAMIVLRGYTKSNPFRFASIPIEQLALELGAYNDTVGIFWKQKMSYRQIKAAYPNGKFSQDFFQKLEKNPEEEIDFYQDYTMEIRGEIELWRMVVHFGDEKHPVVQNALRRRCPIALARYMRVAGEEFGRGPMMQALPTIKTLNVAEQTMMQAALFQMLGMWKIRASGSVNPHTFKAVPGKAIEMYSTGGAMGADLEHLPMVTGAVNLGELISERKREQISNMMLDDRLPDRGATPLSAAEVLSRDARSQQDYTGALAQIVNDIVPNLFLACVEVAYEMGFLTAEELLPFDDFITNLAVLSPVARNLRMRAKSGSLDFMQIAMQFLGDKAEDVVDVPLELLEVGRAMGAGNVRSDTEYVAKKEEREQREQQLLAAQAAMQMAQQIAPQAMQASAASATAASQQGEYA